MKMNLGFLWFKNPADNTPDTMLSFSIVAFSIVCFKLFFGGAVITLPHVVWTIQTMDAGTITALLGSTLGAYVIRRYTDAKFIDSNSNGVDDRQETTTTSTGGQTVTKTTS